jgi:hypothetical protein
MRTECRTFFGSSSFVELRHFKAFGQDGTQTVPKSGKIITDAAAHRPNVARLHQTHKSLNTTQHPRVHKIAGNTLETQIAEENTIPTHTHNYYLGNTNHRRK